MSYSGNCEQKGVAKKDKLKCPGVRVRIPIFQFVCVNHHSS